VVGDQPSLRDFAVQSHPKSREVMAKSRQNHGKVSLKSLALDDYWIGF
jgi:hypothetical protein